MSSTPRKRNRTPTDPLSEFIVLDAPLSEASIEQQEQPGQQGQPLIATLIKAGSSRSGTTEYTPEFLQRCVAEGRFSGALMRCNHPSMSEAQDRPEGDLTRVAGRTGDAYWDPAEKAVKAPIEFLAADVPGSPAQFVRGLFRDPVVSREAGLSIHWPRRVEYAPVEVDGRGKARPRRPVALVGDGKFYVDFVLNPAAGGSVPILAADREETDPMEVIADLTLDDIKRDRPDLIEALRAEAAPPTPPPAPEAPPVDIGAVLREALTPIETKLADLQARLDTQAGNDAVETMVAEAGLSEAHAAIVRAELSGRPFETPEALQEAFGASVARIDQLLESNGTPRVKDLGGAPPADPTDRPTAADALREAGLLPPKEG